MVWLGCGQLGICIYWKTYELTIGVPQVMGGRTERALKDDWVCRCRQLFLLPGSSVIVGYRREQSWTWLHKSCTTVFPQVMNGLCLGTSKPINKFLRCCVRTNLELLSFKKVWMMFMYREATSISKCGGTDLSVPLACRLSCPRFFLKITAVLDVLGF